MNSDDLQDLPKRAWSRLKRLPRWIRLEASWSLDRPETAVVLGFLVLYLLVLVRTAWVSDDAYITFRTVSNFAAGEGLVWNVGERVQAYTHPLWMFLIMAGVYLTREFYFTSLAISILASMAAAIILMRRVARSPMVAVFGLAALVLSRAFVDYSTSGLENPLSHLIAAMYLAVYFGAEKGRPRLLALSLAAALAGLTRLDTLLLYLPSLGLALWEDRSRRSLYVLALGFTPLFAWEFFSLAYYGFLLPNTAYAKLVIDIPASELVAQGFYYLANSLSQDPLTLLIILAGVATAIMAGRDKSYAIAAGSALYMIYLVRIGGDFMSGRFLTLPFFISLVLLVRQELPERWALAGLVLVLVVGFVSPNPTLLSGEGYGADRPNGIDVWGISDERAYYYQGTGLLRARRHVNMPNHPWVHQGIAAKAAASPLVIPTGAGFFGFYAGRGLHLVDLAGLADPLLARIPPMPDPFWRMGHFERRLPEGYLETLASGENRIAEPHLAEYYEKLSRIIQGPLLASGRWGEIWRMNLGVNDHLIEAYLDSLPLKVPFAEVDSNRTDSGENIAHAIRFPPEGIRILLDRLEHARKLHVRLERTTDYLVVFSQGGEELVRKLIPRAGPEESPFSEYVVGLSADDARQGYDTITFYPAVNDRYFRLNSVRIGEG